MSPDFGTGRYGPPIHSVAKWVPDIWARLALWLFNKYLYGSSVMLSREWRWCGNVQVQSGSKFLWAVLAWNKTINQDLYIYNIQKESTNDHTSITLDNCFYQLNQYNNITILFLLFNKIMLNIVYTFTVITGLKKIYSVTTRAWTNFVYNFVLKWLYYCILYCFKT